MPRCGLIQYNFYIYLIITIPISGVEKWTSTDRGVFYTYSFTFHSTISVEKNVERRNFFSTISTSVLFFLQHTPYIVYLSLDKVVRF